MEGKVASKLLSPVDNLGFPRTFEDVIGEDGGRLAKMLKAIKNAYEEFVRGIIEKSAEKEA